MSLRRGNHFPAWIFTIPPLRGATPVLGGKWQETSGADVEAPDTEQ